MPKIIPKFDGEIIDRKLVIDNRDLFDRYIASLRGRASITVKEIRAKRTSGQEDEVSNQNGYYWRVVIPILCDSFGYTPDEMHAALKYKFLRLGGSDDFPKIGSTTDLNKGEWEETMSQIRIWASADYNIYIPEPNEVESK